MTLIMGVRCSNGVVMGADSAATFADAGGRPTIRNDGARKIEIIEKKMIFALTGSTGMAGRISPILLDLWHQRAEVRGPKGLERYPNQPKLSDVAPAKAAEWIRTVLFDRVYNIEGQASGIAHRAGWAAAANEGLSLFMLAIPGGNDRSFSLFTFNAVGLPDEVTDTLFCSNIGSGQPIADPLMGFVRRVLWNDKPPTVNEAILGVEWCLRNTIALHPGGVGGSRHIAALEFNRGTGWGARTVEEAELAEHDANIDDLEDAMRKWKAGKLDPEEGPASPTPPPPAARGSDR